MAFDSATTAQGDDHGRLLVSTADGSGGASIVTIDAGSNAFAWRLSGVIFGSALVGLVYLLAATMFGRRRIAVLAAAFVALDPMSYVMSRISMNDIFVATFIVAAYLVFWQVWSGRWARSAWWALPLVGVLIGLAAASKWVGFYALARPARARPGSVRARAAAARGARGVRARPRRDRRAVAVPRRACSRCWRSRWRSPGCGRSASTSARASARWRRARWSSPASAWPSCSPTRRSTGREPGSAVEYVFGLLARGAEAEWPVWIMIGVAAVLIGWRAYRVAARSTLGRALVPARRDERIRLVVGRRVPGDRAAGRVRADLHPLPAARPRLGDRRRAGLQLVGRRAARPDVRLPLQPGRRATPAPRRGGAGRWR